MKSSNIEEFNLLVDEWIFHKNASNFDKEKRAQQRQLLCPMM